MDFLYLKNKFNKVARATPFQIFCKNCLDLIQTKKILVDKYSNKKSVIVETRDLIHNEFVIKNTINSLGNGWGHIVFCSKENYDSIKIICDEISNDIEIILLEKNITSRDDYNSLLLSKDFWDKIDCEKILIYQTDTFIFKEFDDKFLEFDYLGAPWNDKHADVIKKKLGINVPFGNGGLSLRDVEFCKKTLSNDYDSIIYKPLGNDLSLIEEDLFFSYYFVKQNKDLGDIVYDFSYESYFKEDFREDLFMNKKLYGCHAANFFFNSKVFFEKWTLKN